MRSLFVEWLGSENARNAGFLWWAHLTAAKNVMTSPLGDRLLEVLAVAEYLLAGAAPPVAVVGMADAQAKVLMRSLALAAAGWGFQDLRKKKTRPSWNVLHGLVQIARTAAALPALRRARQSRDFDLLLFTYVDADFREDRDAFFGRLAIRVMERTPRPSTLHVAYFNDEPRKVLPLLGKTRLPPYEPLYGWLTWSDLLWCAVALIVEAVRIPRYRPREFVGLDVTPILVEEFRRDLGPGGYAASLLVYRASRRLTLARRPRLLIYPFENKAIEKLLVLGVRSAHPACRLVGYQHTSVTPRHSSLLFAEGEAKVTPLPDRIVTVGEVSKQWLQRLGRYPAGLLTCGCSLRHHLGEPLARRAPNGGSRVLLALSSTLRELQEAVRLIRRAKAIDSGLAFSVRPHPAFPIALLAEEDRSWLATNAVDCSGTPLRHNLAWCDVVAYASSTVAIEALAAGRPVINLVLSDYLDPDPVLDSLAFHWKANDERALAKCVHEVAALSTQRYEASQAEALQYVQRYLHEPTERALDAFFDSEVNT